VWNTAPAATNEAASRPLVEHDFRIAAACARALASFFVRNPRSFAADETTPACESFSDDVGPTVRDTAPYEAFPLFEFEDERPGSLLRAAKGARRPGRNDPCQCGSGRKYKKCHLRDDERSRGEARRSAALHALDERLVTEISAFAFARFGVEARAWVTEFDDPAQVLPLAMPWSVYHFCVQGRPAFEWFLEEASPRPGADERRWLDAQRASWLSVWEVIEVRAGEGLELRDLFAEEERSVREILATETVVKRDCILARVVVLDEAAVLGGTHPRPLPPVEAAEITPGARSEVAVRLLALDGVLPPDADDADPSYDVLRDPPPGSPGALGATLLRSVRLSGDRVHPRLSSSSWV
jgi:hypothetical protein